MTTLKVLNNHSFAVVVGELQPDGSNGGGGRRVGRRGLAGSRKSGLLLGIVP